MVPPLQARRNKDAATSGSAGKEGPLYNPLYFLARFALALAPSAVMGAGLVPLLAEPRASVAAQADDNFKVCAGGREIVCACVCSIMLRERGGSSTHSDPWAFIH